MKAWLYKGARPLPPYLWSKKGSFAFSRTPRQLATEFVPRNNFLRSAYIPVKYYGGRFVGSARNCNCWKRLVVMPKRPGGLWLWRGGSGYRSLRKICSQSSLAFNATRKSRLSARSRASSRPHRSSAWRCHNTATFRRNSNLSPSSRLSRLRLEKSFMIMRQ